MEKQMVYSLHPEWLRYCLDLSLKRLGVETIDCVYLSEPIEHLVLQYQDEKEMKMRIAHAFGFLEEMVQDGKIKGYGLQAEQSFLIDPELIAARDNVGVEQIRTYQLQHIIDIASSVGGPNHNFKFLQMPISKILHQSFTNRTQ